MCQMADWLTAFGTIFLGAVALFQDHIRRFMFKPKLDVAANSFEPSCIKKTIMQVGTGWAEHPHYDLRITVRNSGNTEARYVQVFAKNLERQDGHGIFARVPNFIETYLAWSPPRQPELDLLNPGLPRFCDIARVFDTDGLPQDIRSVANLVREATFGTRTILSIAPQGGFGQIFPPGNYRLTIVLGAANAKTIENVLKINVTGAWTERVSEVLEFGTLSS